MSQQSETIAADDVQLGDVISLPDRYDREAPGRVVGITSAANMRFFVLADLGSGETDATRYGVREDVQVARQVT